MRKTRRHSLACVAKVWRFGHHTFIKASRPRHDAGILTAEDGNKREGVTCNFMNIGRSSPLSELSPIPRVVRIAATLWSPLSPPNSLSAAKSVIIGNVMPAASLPARASRSRRIERHHAKNTWNRRWSAVFAACVCNQHSKEEFI